MSSVDDTRSSVTRAPRTSKERLPDFINEEAAYPEAISEEFISVLVAENADILDKLPDGSHVYSTREAAQYIFTICVRLRLPDDIKYLALEVFDRFMNAHAMQLWEMVTTCAVSSKKKYKSWEKTETTLSRQLTLRMCTAIQIASKIHSFHDSLSKIDVRKCLQALGFPYIEEAIHKSELRVLQTLNFNICSRRSTSIYLINFLKLLVRRKPELGNNIEILYRYCLFSLDYTLLNRDIIFTNILEIVHAGNPVPVTKDKMARVQADYALLACGVIISGLLCFLGPAVAEVYIVELSVITSIAENDISDAVTGIIRSLLRGKKREKKNTAEHPTKPLSF